MILAHDTVPQDVLVALFDDPNVTQRLVQGGGNSRVFRIESGDQLFALKQYPDTADGGRNRQLTETRALCFLETQQIFAVPHYIDSYRHFSVLSWIDGETLRFPQEQDFSAISSFCKQLFELSPQAKANEIPLAYDACVSLTECTSNLKRRITELSEAVSDDIELSEFMHEVLLPASTTAIHRAFTYYDHAGISVNELPRVQQRLIHGDFGLHNMLRSADGTITLIDFEYFGWDDPARMIADFLLHPGIEISAILRRRFLTDMSQCFKGRAQAMERLTVLLPLMAIRWACITLNQFSRDRWSQRGQPRLGGTWDSAKKVQLAKARALVDQCKGGDLFD